MNLLGLRNHGLLKRLVFWTNFNIFFNDTKARFFNFLIRLTGDKDRAADAFQESYLRYWQRYGKQAPNTGLLFTIGRNIAFDGHRRKKHHQPISEEKADDRQSQEQTVIVKEEYNRVMKAMDSLDPVERQVLSLAVDGGFRYEQIAEMTQLSLANVKVKIHRARRKLQDSLKEA